MIKTRIIETAIDHKGDSYIFSDKNKPPGTWERHIPISFSAQNALRICWKPIRKWKMKTSI